MNDLVQPTPTQTAVATIDPASPSALLVLAVERQAPLDYIERLLALKRETDKDAARNAYNVAMAEFCKRETRVTRSSNVEQGPLKGTAYAKLSDFVRAASSGLAECGLSVSWQISRDEKDWIEVACVVRHVMGHEERRTMGGPPDVGGAKNAIQARASTVSYLEKYTFKMALGLAEENDDDDGNGGQGNNGASGNASPRNEPPPRRDEPPAQLPAYPQEKFDQNLPEWAALIHTGEKSAVRIIAFLEKKTSLTPEQKKKLTDLEPKQ